MTKQFHIKPISGLEKFIPLGIVLMIFSGWIAWDLKPNLFYKQKSGTVINIKESKRERSSNGPRSSAKYYFDEIYIFDIDGKEIEIRKQDINYNYLIGKTIKYKTYMYRYRCLPLTWCNTEEFVEIIYDNHEVYSQYNVKWFLICSIVFMLSLFGCICFFVSKWQNAPPEKKKSNNDEETFFENWAVRKKNDKCTLAYVSKLDGTLKHIKISLDDYESAKNGNMNLNDFSEKYNLW